jgi:predicted RNA-binding protein
MQKRKSPFQKSIGRVDRRDDWVSEGGMMCEANAYLSKENKEELVLEDIMILRPEEGEIYLQNIFGEQKRLKARIKEMNLVDHRIILEEI